MLVRDGHQVRNKATHIVVGVDLDGVKHVLGIWVQTVEGAKFWAGVCAELRNRGVREVLIVCCGELTGLPEAIEATWPQSTAQTCEIIRLETSGLSCGWNSSTRCSAATTSERPGRRRAW